jgi:hypothetical protein
MQELLHKIKPARGFSHPIYVGLNVLLPILAWILVRIDFVSVAIILILLAKWRIFAVRPRYWLTNIIASGIDIIVGITFVLFVANTISGWWQFFWVVAYIAWLTGLKPRSDVVSVSLQAMIGQLLGLSVLYLKFGDTSLVGLVAGTWVVAYLAARHFFTSFVEPHTVLLAQLWAFFAASLAFILGHWLLFYGDIAQITVLLTTIGYGLAALYYLEASERLTAILQKQLLLIMGAILLIALALSNWSGSTV